jgi:uncharacterized protein (DUF305 family)
MKRVLSIIGLAGLLAACNNDTATEGTNTDHSTHTTDTASTTTAAPASPTMMSLMHGNMAQMKAVAATGNADRDYAALMKVHHQGAVDMAQMLLAQGADPQLKEMAQKMITEQQGEIARFDSALASLPAQGTDTAFYSQSIKAMDAMHMDMNHTGSIEKDFVQMMIPHHQGAIDMSRTYLKSGASHAGLKALANAIISDQQKEIADMQAWLDRNK